MKATPSRGTRDTKRWGPLRAIARAVAASICRLGPLVLLFLGVAGARVGSPTGLVSYGPVSMVATFGSLESARPGWTDGGE